MAAYCAAAGILYVLPAIVIYFIFPVSYDSIVTFPLYAAFMGILSLMGAAMIVEEMSEKI